MKIASNRNMKIYKRKIYEKYAWIIFIIIGFIFLLAAISYTFDINTAPTLVQVISGQTIDEIKISNPIIYESSVLILLIKGFLEGALRSSTHNAYFTNIYE